MTNNHRSQPLPAFSAITWMCAQVYLNTPGKRGVPPVNVSLEILMCPVEQMDRFQKVPVTFMPMQQRVEFRRTIKRRNDPELSAAVEAIFEAFPADQVRFGIVSEQNLGIYVPAASGDRALLRILFADGCHDLTLEATRTVKAGTSAYRLYHDPHGAYAADRGAVRNRRKISPVAAEISALRDQVQQALGLVKALSTRVDDLEAERRQTRLLLNDLQGEIVRLNQAGPVVIHAPAPAAPVAPLTPRERLAQIKADIAARGSVN